MTATDDKFLSREDLETENARLRALLAQAGIDARRSGVRQAAREAGHQADLSLSRAEARAAREEARRARVESDEAEADRAASDRFVAELQAIEARLRTVLETVPVGILLAEAPSGRIVMGNGRIEEILGHPPLLSPDTSTYGDYVGYHPDGRRVDGHEWPLARIIGGCERAQMEAHYQRPDGRRVWVSVSGAAIRDEAGATIGGVIAIADIEARKRAEAAQDILNRELSHRLKNTLTLVQAIAAQTLRNAPGLEAAREALAARLVALGKAHDILLSGRTDGTCVAAVIEGALALHEDSLPRFRLDGPRLPVGPSAALSLALMMHELATNAAKYGALSNETGRVDIAWSVLGEADEAAFRLVWTERGGPPVVPPGRKGFGSRLIERGLAGDVGGSVALAYPAEGVVCTLTASLAGFQTGL